MSDKTHYLLSLRFRIDNDKTVDKPIHPFYADTANEALKLAQRMIMSDEMNDLISKEDLDKVEYFVVSILRFGRGLGFGVGNIEWISKDGQTLGSEAGVEKYYDIYPTI